MARLMSSTELYERMEEDDDFVLVDVHDPEGFQREHIPGAVNIPLPELQPRAPKELSKNQRIVVYGQNHEAESSAKAALILEELGFRKISDFDGGIVAWKRAGFQTNGTETKLTGEITAG